MTQLETPHFFDRYQPSSTLCEPFKCALCGDSFETFTQLVEHLDVPHRRYAHYRGVMVFPIRSLLGGHQVREIKEG
jgi:hypothetical protein